MRKLFHWLDEYLEESIMVVLLAVISCTIMLQIVMRYCFSSAMPWPEELCRFCFVYSGFLSAGYCIKKKTMLRVDVLLQFMPKIFQDIITYLGKFLVLVVYLYLGYSAFGLIASTSTVSSAMQVPYKLVYAALPIGFFLGAFRQVQEFVLLFLDHKKKKEAV